MLEHKPGAFAGSTPLAQWRAQGRWPASYDQLWEGLMARHGRQHGTKAMIELLQLGRRYGQEQLRAAVETAPSGHPALGCGDSAAVRHLLTTRELARERPAGLEVGGLSQFERPLPTVDAYAQLLAGGLRDGEGR